jgi:protein-S-isoprenylcysteine O-methyltransferase Ste14
LGLLLKNLLFTVVVPGTVAVYLPLLLLSDREPGSWLWRALALVFYLAGIGIYSWCVWDFAVFGRGTPAPIDAPKKLVVRGLYHYTRNPMYLGVLMTILGWAVLFQEFRLVVYALFVAGCFQSFVVLYEEPHLRKAFGSAYDDYCAKVSRWLPSVRRSRMRSVD